MRSEEEIRCPNCRVDLVEVDPFEMDVFSGSGIYGCPSCKELWLFSIRECSSNSEFLAGNTCWSRSIERYTRQFCCYEEMRERFNKMMEED